MTYDLNDSLDIDFSPAWIAEPLDKLIGIVVDKSSRTTDDGEYPILTVKITQTPTPVRLKDGSEAKVGDLVAWHVMGTIAQNGASDACLGDEIGIKRKADYAHKTRKDRKDPSKPLMMRDWKIVITPARPDYTSVVKAAELDEPTPSADDLI